MAMSKPNKSEIGLSDEPNNMTAQVVDSEHSVMLGTKAFLTTIRQSSTIRSSGNIVCVRCHECRSLG
jgi:hypothetical protein